MSPRTYGDVLLIISAVPAIAAPLIFARVDWHRSRLGIHMMSYMAVVGIVFALGLARLQFGTTPGFEWLRAAVYTLVPVILWWRLAVVVSAQRRGDLLHQTEPEEGSS